MQEIKCPKCGEVFQVDGSGYAAILKQVHDKEFEKEIQPREEEFKVEKKNAVDLATTKLEADKDKEIAALQKNLEIEKQRAKQEIDNSASRNALELAEKDKEISRLKGQLKLEKTMSESAVDKAVREKEKEILQLKNDLELEKKQA